MADDLDNLLRAAMKTLDEQVPSGYFDALPNQTLARLEGSMQQQGSSGSTTETRDNVAPPVLATTAVEPEPAAVAKHQAMEERDEDSGLHDIRNLAQSTKQRLSSRRNSTSPPVADDVLASSSGSFKNIALPQPANMVSLPAVEDLPSKAEVAAAEKAAKEAAKRAAKEKKAESAASVAAAAPAVAAVAPAAPSPSSSFERKAFTLPSQQRKGSKGPVLAIVGLGLAAAAGAVIYMQVSKQDAAPAPTVAAAEQPKVETAAVAPAPAAAPAVTAEPIAEPEAPPAEPAQEEPAAAAQIAADDAKDDDEDDAKRKKRSAKGGKQKVEKDEAPKVDVKAPEKVEAKKPAAKGGEAEGEPSFDALLKEAGVSEKKEAKPVLEKKSLTGDDFKKGIGAVTPKAKGCYKGTQGTAMVKLTVAPSGSISKVAVTGEFAGKPEAACVESAIKAATFPPWDGGPQSFTYSVLLSD